VVSGEIGKGRTRKIKRDVTVKREESWQNTFMGIIKTAQESSQEGKGKITLATAKVPFWELST